MQGSRTYTLPVWSTLKSLMKRNLHLFRETVRECEQDICGTEMTLGDGHSCQLAWDSLGESSEDLRQFEGD